MKIDKMLTPPANLNFKIDKKNYDLIVDVTDKIHLTEQRLNRFIIIQIIYYRRGNCQEQKIMNLFKKDFKR
jgi:hypothetical protein